MAIGIRRGAQQERNHLLGERLAVRHQQMKRIRVDLCSIGEASISRLCTRFE
jgi:hypothetical protein